ncbi:T9SS type A sorting domain-containing protein [Spirosoma endbachense]|uniref:T9SS type A sorting domain-containing protein n=1 Tax=Spirosoma endbachense TaxID=2666025 RepID=A0A6P1W4W4_9BACT|nr:T9SS type A sorting domain-containing protein [Spirosoma endbachense]QHW00492.1 T9SS type A sorting domain-containing protein [Spirosoma endbachense]
MKLLTILAGCCLALNSQAQSPPKNLRIQLSYEKAGQYLQQAVETIEASNTIGLASTVDYKAGRSITLMAGFEAKSGSTFTANIQPVTSEGEISLQLKAYPNPFEHSTRIDYYLPADGVVNLWVIDAQGKIVGQLIQGENQSAGKHQVEWKPSALDAGIYIPIIEANQQKVTTRIVKK